MEVINIAFIAWGIVSIFWQLKAFKTMKALNNNSSKIEANTEKLYEACLIFAIRIYVENEMFEDASICQNELQKIRSKKVHNN